MRNQKGNVAVLLLILLAGLIAVMGWKRRHEEPVQAKHVAVKKLKPKCEEGVCKGAYAYQNGDEWLFYYIVLGQSNSPAYQTYVTTQAPAIPSGGSWSRASAPASEEVEQEIEVAQNDQGEPEIAAQSIEEITELAADAETNGTAEPGSSTLHDPGVAESSEISSGSARGDGGLDSGQSDDSASSSESSVPAGDSSSSGSFDSGSSDGSSFDSGSSGDGGGGFSD